MKVDVVADVGNSRIKWGLCDPNRVRASVSLPLDDSAEWKKQAACWQLLGPASFLVAGVHPVHRDAFAEWAKQRWRGTVVRVLDSASDLPLQVILPQPDKVGIDRLLNAVAANDRAQRSVAKMIVDAGSAVTVDWVDEQGAFRGGAIFPGLRLMTKALNDHTALLPLVEIKRTSPDLPGVSTQAAIEAGVFWAVAGGIKALACQLTSQAHENRQVFLTGGDAGLLAPVMDTDVILWPEMTLEGLRLAAEALP